MDKKTGISKNMNFQECLNIIIKGSTVVTLPRQENYLY